MSSGNPKKSFVIATTIIVIAMFVLTVIIQLRPDIRHRYGACTAMSASSTEKARCLKELAESVVASHDEKMIAPALLALYTSEEILWCHEFTHYIGWALYEQRGGLSSFGDAFDSCENGVYHGIIERHVRIYQGNDLVVFAKDACDDAVTNGALVRSRRGTCMHGLGHGFMIARRNDLATALSDCDRLGERGMAACASGAFMEGIWQKKLDNGGTGSIFATSSGDDICATTEMRYKETCYMTRGISFDLATRRDHHAAFLLCHGVDQSYRHSCFYGVGMNIPDDHIPAREAAASCSVSEDAGEDAYRACIEAGLDSPEYGSKRSDALLYCSGVAQHSRAWCEAFADTFSV